MPDFRSPYSQRPYPDTQPYLPRKLAETKPNCRELDELRSGDADPAKRAPNESAGRGLTGFTWRAATPVLISTGLGLGSIQIADQRAFHGANYGTSLAFFWCGLILVFVPISLRAIMRRTPRGERIALILFLAASLYVVKIENSPYGFTYNDEYIHWVNTQHILNSGHIFQYNPLLATASFYPGLAAVTSSLVHLTGLSIFVSGLLVIGVERIIIAACLYLATERITGSSRAAAFGSIIYAANPMFLFWSAQFSYESLGLPIATFTVWWLYKTRKNEGCAAQIVTVLAIGALTLTHHISAFALTGILATWLLGELIARKPRQALRYVAVFTLLAGAASSVWFFMVARPATGYLIGDNIVPALREIKELITGHAGRHLYSGGPVSPMWFRLLAFAATAVIVLALPSALYRAWTMCMYPSKGIRRYRYVPLAVAAIIATSYPFTLLLRLTSVGGSISARSSEYVFIGLSPILGLLAVESAMSRPAVPNRLYRALGKLFRPVDLLLAGWRGTLVLTAMATAIFVGEIAVGSVYSLLLPAPSNSTGYPSVVQADVISASIWARDHVGVNRPFATDLVDSLALATYGDENTKPEEQIFAIFLGDSLDGLPAALIKKTGTRYILVDWRMTYGPPSNSGEYYFSQWEPQAGHYLKPFNVDYLKKFTSYSCSKMIYHSGPVQIFDVSRIENGTCTPRLINPAPDTVRSPHEQGTSDRKASP